MEITNSGIAAILDQMADTLDILGDNPFRIRAYRNASRTITNTQSSIAEMIAKEEDLTELPGIGKDLGGKIAEIVQTGTLKDLEKLTKRVPSTLTTLMKLPTLGPKKAKTLYAKLHVKTLADLKRAAQEGKIRKLAGFGEKTEKRIAEELDRLEARGPERVKLNVADEEARLVERHIAQAPGLGKTALAGSCRRRAETVGDLDFIVTCEDNAAVISHFVKYGGAAKILAEGPTKASLLLRSGLQVDLRAVADESYGAALLYFTGSKAHNIALRARALARKLKINEYGVYKGARRIASRTEEDVYAAVGLPFIEPELRENRGEIEAAAAGRLPVLVRSRDVKGDLHAHTSATDGSATPEEMAEGARRLGYEYLAMTDHTVSTRVAGGLDARALRRQWKAIDKLNSKFKDFTILKSAEVDILEDGSLDLPDSVLREMDVVVCSIHSRFNLSREKQTERILRAMDNPRFHVFGHPTGRLIPGREPYVFDFDRIIAAAVERRCILEINGQPDRMDVNDSYARQAEAAGALFTISSDAHSVSQLQNMNYGVSLARRAWLEKKDVINTRPLSQLRQILSKSGIIGFRRPTHEAAHEGIPAR